MADRETVDVTADCEQCSWFVTDTVPLNEMESTDARLTEELMVHKWREHESQAP